VPDSADKIASEAPLAGRFVVVTRTAEQSRALAAPLEAAGATVLASPAIAIVDPPDTAPLRAAIGRLTGYTWIVFTSANAVERFVGAGGGDGLRVCPHPAIAVVGSATAAALQAHGIEPDLIPGDYRAEGLVEAFERLGAGPGWRVLIPRALEAREILPDTLRELGAVVDVVPAYRTVAAQPDPQVVERLSAGTVDAVTFTSPSTVRNFLEGLRMAGIEPATALEGVVLASIGPVTTDALVKAGLAATVEAEPSTVEALIDALTARLIR
jgi:uroporphyrinogen III methyltransferase/synthase